MKKRNWKVTVEDWRQFQMVSLDGDIDASEALANAKAIWPGKKIQVE